MTSCRSINWCAIPTFRPSRSPVPNPEASNPGARQNGARSVLLNRECQRAARSTSQREDRPLTDNGSSFIELYLLRHAIAEDHSPSGRDADRRLTDDGRKKLRRVLERARKASVTPTLILSSPLKRA